MPSKSDAMQPIRMDLRIVPLATLQCIAPGVRLQA